jgi:hypothetical protein
VKMFCIAAHLIMAFASSVRGGIERTPRPELDRGRGIDPRNRQGFKKEQISLREIASAAQVSIATVSRVLNGSTRVNPAIPKSVLAAAAELDVDFTEAKQDQGSGISPQ